jgi:hypothetical protein
MHGYTRRVLFASMYALFLINFGTLQASAGTLSLLGAGRGAPAGGGGGGYIGPGDVQATKWWYGLRALSSATRGNKLVNICTTIATVDTCADMLSDATTGAMILTTIGGAACNTSTQPYNIKTWYELNGTGNDQTEAAVAARAVLTICNGTTTGAAFTIAGLTNYLTSSVTQAQPFEIVWAAAHTANFTTQSNVFESGGNLQDGYWTTTGQAYGYTGTVVSFAASNTACHVIQIVHNGASGEFAVDGASYTTSQNFGSSGISAADLYLGGGGSGREVDMTFYEGGLIASGSPASLYANIHGYGNC